MKSKQKNQPSARSSAFVSSYIDRLLARSPGFAMIASLPPVLAFASLTLIIGLASSAKAEQKSRDQRRSAQEVYLTLGDEPPSMDPTKQADGISGFWLGHLYEGLLTYDQKGVLVPGTAERFTVSADKKTWTFVIRANAKWHDGQPVKAADFEFAMRRLVDPTYASEYAFIATAAGILNAEEVITKRQPVTALGVKALDARTLEIRLSRPVPYFESLMAFQVFFPVRKDLVDKFGDKFAAGPESLIGNGAFKLASWQKEQSMRLEKADTYWNAKAVRLNAIESPAMVKDGQANFNNFQTGGIDIASAGSPEIIKQAQAAKLRIQTFPSGCIEYLAFNTRAGHPFASQELRLAVQAGLSRAEYINKIVGIPGFKTAFGLVPDNTPGSKPASTYRREAPLVLKDADVPTAKQHLAKYLAAAKLDKVPTFTVLSTDSTRAKHYAEYFQHALASLTNAEVKVETVPFKSMLQKQRDGHFDVSMGGWCPDYRDAMTFMDLFTTKNDNNYTGFSNKTYDALIEKAALEPDAARRIALFAEAERLLTAEAPVVPTSQTAGAFVSAPGLVGFRRTDFGADPDLRYAFWQDKGSASH